MPDLPQPNADSRLNRLSTLSGILLPLVVALVGGLYTYQKDQNDTRTQKREQRRDSQRVRYENLTALIPLLTSQDPASRALGMEIFTSEAKKREAPLDLLPVIRRLASQHPEIQGQATEALAAANGQITAEKNANP